MLDWFFNVGAGYWIISCIASFLSIPAVYLIFGVIYSLVIIFKGLYSDTTLKLEWFIEDKLYLILFSIPLTICCAGLLFIIFALLSEIHIAIGIVFMVMIFIIGAGLIKYKSENGRNIYDAR